MEIVGIIVAVCVGLMALGALWEFVIKPILEWLLESKIFMFILFLVIIAVIVGLAVLAWNFLVLFFEAI